MIATNLHPFDWLPDIVPPVARFVWWFAATPVRNVGQLGPFFPLAWGMAIAGLASFGSWGAASGDVLFKGGEDVAAFGGNRAAFLGWGAKVIKVRKHAQAAVSGTAVVVGWGGAALLYVVALVWWLCIPLLLGYGYLRWWQQQPRDWQE